MLNIAFVIFFSLTVKCFALDEYDIELMDQFGILKSRVESDSDQWTSNYLKKGKVGRNIISTRDKETTVWKDLKEDEWLDINKWIAEREFKDSNPNWKDIVRNQQNREVIGRVIKCVGLCRNYRGVDAASAKHLTTLREGDEFLTEDNSYAWLLLIDGSLIRVSPKTSLILNEVNLSNTSNFIMLRLNEGIVHFQPRLNGKFLKKNLPETDTAFNPLLIREANREFHAINEFQALDEKVRDLYLIKENPGADKQYELLNRFISENPYQKSTKVLFVTPSYSLLSSNIVLDLNYNINGKSFFRYSENPKGFEAGENSRNKDIKLQLRGYNNDELNDISKNTWYEVNKDGSKFYSTDSYPRALDTVSAFTRRIPSILIGREVFMRKYFNDLILKTNFDDEELLSEYNYRLWNVESKIELNQRVLFLLEWSRRVETSNLKNISKIFPIFDVKSVNNSYFALALGRHFSYLKKLYNDNRKSILYMNKSEFYLWLLRNGKNEI